MLVRFYSNKDKFYFVLKIIMLGLRLYIILTTSVYRERIQIGIILKHAGNLLMLYYNIERLRFRNTYQ